MAKPYLGGTHHTLAPHLFLLNQVNIMSTDCTGTKEHNEEDNVKHRPRLYIMSTDCTGTKEHNKENNFKQTSIVEPRLQIEGFYGIRMWTTIVVGVIVLKQLHQGGNMGVSANCKSVFRQLVIICINKMSSVQPKIMP